MYLSIIFYNSTCAFLKIGEYHFDIHQFYNVAEYIQSQNAFRPIACEQKYLMDYKS